VNNYQVKIQITSEAELEALGLSEEATKKLRDELKETNRQIAASARESAGEQERAQRRIVDLTEDMAVKQQRAAIQTRTLFLPLAASVGMLTQSIQQTNPALGALVSTIDNFVVSAVAGAAAVGGLSGALSAIRALLNPLALAIIGAGAAIAYFVTQAQTAKRAQEEWTATMSALEGRIAVLRASTEMERIATRTSYERSIALRELRKAFDDGKISQEQFTERTLELLRAFEDLGRAEQSDRLRQARQALGEAIAQNNNQLMIEQRRLEAGEMAALELQQALEREDITRRALGRERNFSIEQIKREAEANRVLARDILELTDRRRLAQRELDVQRQMEADLAEVYAASARDRQTLLQRERDAIEVEREINQAIADGLALRGATTEADRARLQAQLDYLRRVRDFEERQNSEDQVRLRNIQIQNTEEQLRRLGTVSVNVGQTIAQSLGDAFQGVILGTSKLADVGKNFLAALVRDVSTFFTQLLLKKSGFETLLLSNASGFVPQLTAAIGGASGSLPGSQSGGGIVGNLLGNIGNLIGNLFGGGSIGSLGGLLPGGLSLGGLLASGLGGLALGKLAGGGLGGQIGSSIGSLLGNILGALNPGTISLFGSTFSGFTLSGIASEFLGETLGNFLLPGIGSVIGFLLGGLFQRIPNPSVWVKTIIKFYYDALTTSFNAFVQASIVRFRDISGGKAQQVLAEHQKIMDGVAKAYVDLLNTFPAIVHDSIVPFIDDANRVLADWFGSKKYSEGGSRNIRQELDDLKNKEAPWGFWYALRQGVGAGLNQLFRMSGFDFSEIIARQFPAPIKPTPIWGTDPRVNAGLEAPFTSVEDAGKFIDAMQRFIAFGASLSNVAPGRGGVSRFLTDADMSRLDAEIRRVLESKGGTEFAGQVDEMLKRVQPVADFLQQAVTEASNLFGRGMMAALEAATESQAMVAFRQTLSDGIKETLFRGITESFIASAQFTDLLAPIQQTIRKFTQEAIDSGTVPDIAAFRRAILPSVEEITTRAEVLAPLIAELQKLGIDVKNLLAAFVGENAAAPTVHINIESFGGSDDDIDALRRRLEALLRGSRLPVQG
jgi:hypothetical protein